MLPVIRRQNENIGNFSNKMFGRGGCFCEKSNYLFAKPENRVTLWYWRFCEKCYFFGKKVVFGNRGGFLKKVRIDF